MKSIALKQRLRDRLDIIGLLAFAVIVLFIAFPNLLFSQNVEEIPRAVTYYRYFFAGAFIVLLVLASIFLCLPRRVALIAASVLGAYALLVLIFDLVQPLEIGWIEEGTEREPAAPVAGAIQILLMVGAGFAIYHVPKKARGVLAWALAAVLLVSGLPFLFAAPDSGHVTGRFPIEKDELAPDFNVYHIVLDAYYGPWLAWSLEELERDTSELAGFTHYTRNFSQYIYTWTSYPSFMTGTMYSPDKTVTEWHESADESSIVDELCDRGFCTYHYGLYLLSGIRQVGERYIDDPGGTGVVDIRLAADYWLLRVAPVALRHVVLDERGAGPISRGLAGRGEDPVGDIRNVISYRQFQRFLADEHERPSTGQYVHAHFLPPHGPYQLDRYGNYVGESSYEEQVLLATNMLLEFVETLKALNRFDSSLIIVHADHGHWVPARSHFIDDPSLGFVQIDDVTSDAIRGVDVRALSGRVLEARYQALLLIKPPGVGDDAGDLIVNDALVQLLDLREYINTVLDEGDFAYPEREQVSVQSGLRLQIHDGQRLTVGRDIMEGYINHYIIRPGGEWEIADNIPFVYE